MASQDEHVGLALGVLAALIAGVVALVIGLAVVQDDAAASRAENTQDELEAVAPESAVSLSGPPLATVHFGPGSAALPADITKAVLAVIKTAGQRDDSVIVVSGFLDNSGNAERQALLAKERTLAVMMALVGAGISQDRIHLPPPVPVEGRNSARAARRVELRIR